MPKLALTIPESVEIATPHTHGATTQAPHTVSRRRLLTGTAPAIAALALPAAVIAAPALNDADAPLFDLCRRWREMEPVMDRLSDINEKLHEALPSQLWTPEELTAHRIDGDKTAPRYLSLQDIVKNDDWDHPERGKSSHTTSESDDGLTTVMTITIRRHNASAEELAAWKLRCEARRALYDAKMAAYEEAREASGARAADDRLGEAYCEHDRLLNEIKAYLPRTVAGVLEKMRVYRAEGDGTFDGEPDELSWSATLFLSALADFERLVGGEGSTDA